MLTIDPMHNLYLGTAKYIFNDIWIKNGVITNAHLEKVNERISSLIIPPEVRFGRLPASMGCSSSLTAEQWMLWVNYYSLYCLYQVIPSEHLECWRHFVLASRLLCKRQISKDEVRIADALLMQFCCLFEVLYGPQAVTTNIHLHAHLADCIEDYGPMSNFWLFSFERLNGILGDEPTNNHSIEVQLTNHFLEDNSHFQLLSSIPRAASDITNIFLLSVVDCVYSFTSTRHLDMTSTNSPVEDIVLPTKYTISTFSETEMGVLSKIYHQVFPSVFNQDESLYSPRSYRKLLYVTIKGQKVKAGQYVRAKSVFPFTNSGAPPIRTVFTDPDIRPAKIHYFISHSIQVSDTECSTHAFALASWPMQHPLQHPIGKPFEVWCSSLYESCPNNCILPVGNIVSSSLVAHQVFEEETVLVTVPLIL